MARKLKSTDEDWLAGHGDPSHDLYRDTLGEVYVVRPDDMKACSKEKASTLRKILKDMGHRKSGLKASEIKIMTQSDLAAAVAAKAPESCRDLKMTERGRETR